MSEQEDVEFGEGQDPCIHIVRMYEDIDTKKEIESNHSPTQWRNSYIQLEFHAHQEVDKLRRIN
jgi:hypothetical protein